MAFALCRQAEKLPVLLNLCRALNKQRQKTIIFCATMKHVEHVGDIYNISQKYFYNSIPYLVSHSF